MVFSRPLPPPDTLLLSRDSCGIGAQAGSRGLERLPTNGAHKSLDEVNKDICGSVAFGVVVLELDQTIANVAYLDFACFGASAQFKRSTSTHWLKRNCEVRLVVDLC